MNFLQLAQRTRQECGISGSGPVSVQDQAGELRRIVDWVRDSWTEIQNERVDWLWMRRGFTLTTEDAKGRYHYADAIDDDTGLPISRFSRWWIDDALDPAKIYLQSSGVGGQYWLSYFSWPDFKAIYLLGIQQSTTGMPAQISHDPQRRIYLGPIPNDVYVVQAEYQVSAQELVEDVDVPEMPEQYHMLIVMRALEKYAYFEGAQEALSRAHRVGGRLMDQLIGNQSSDIRMAGPLA